MSADVPIINLDWESIDNEVNDLANLILEIELTPLDNAEYVNIGELEKLVLSKDKVYLSDRIGSLNETLWIFDNDGRFEKAIHTPGKGPGEYLEIDDFFTNEAGEEIFIIDARSDKMLIYSKEGVLLEEVSLPLEQGKYLSLQNDKILKLRGRFISKNETAPYHEMEIIDYQNNKSDRWFGFKNRWEGWKPDENELCYYKDGVIVHHPYDFNLYFLSSSNSLMPLLRFDYGSKTIDTSGYYASNSFIDFHMQCNNRQGKYEYKIGQILPMGDDFFVSKRIDDQVGFMIISGKDFSYRQYKSRFSGFLGFYKGWPVPVPTSYHGQFLIGVASPFEIFEMWTQFPEMKTKASSESKYKSLIQTMKIDDNPILFRFRIEAFN